MEQKEAANYPFFKDFEFNKYIHEDEGIGMLLIPKEGIYFPKRFFYPELSFAQYLQDTFRYANHESTVGGLLSRLDEDNENIFLDKISNVIDSFGINIDTFFEHAHPQTFYVYYILRKYQKNGMIKFGRTINLAKDIDISDQIIKGDNYDEVRVLALNGNVSGYITPKLITPDIKKSFRTT